MALPTTALQVEMMVAAWQRQQDSIVETMQQIYVPALTDLIFRRIFLQRPRTDDMGSVSV